MLKFKAERRAEQALKARRKVFRDSAEDPASARAIWEKPNSIHDRTKEALASIGITEVTEEMAAMLDVSYAMGQIENMVDELTPLEQTTIDDTALRIEGVRARRGRNLVSSEFLAAMEKDFERRQTDGYYNSVERLVADLVLDAQMRVIPDEKNPGKLKLRSVEIDRSGRMRLSDNVFIKSLD